MRLPILMFHQVAPVGSRAHGLSIDENRLEKHFEVIKENGYTPIHFKDIMSSNQLPKNPIILTFDDVYLNQFNFAYPLLKFYKFKACFYVPFKYIGGFNAWDDGQEAIMSMSDLKSLDSDVIELGLHSYAHGRYDVMTIDEIEEDLEKCESFIKSNDLDVSRVLAYPYGKFPRKGKRKEQFFDLLKRSNIAFGLRIGNRLNRIPFQNNFEIQRIDVKGEDSDKTFKKKLRYGRGWF